VSTTIKKASLVSFYQCSLVVARAGGTEKHRYQISLTERTQKVAAFRERCTCSKGSLQSAAEGAEFPFCEARNGSGGMLLGRRDSDVTRWPVDSLETLCRRLLISGPERHADHRITNADGRNNECIVGDAKSARRAISFTVVRH
jgi:hypothetical protein